MYIPINIHEYDQFINPFCLMFLESTFRANDGHIYVTENTMIIKQDFDDGLVNINIQLFIKTIEHLEYLINHHHDEMNTINPNEIDDEIQDSITILHTIKQVMCDRLLNSMTVTISPIITRQDDSEEVRPEIQILYTNNYLKQMFYDTFFTTFSLENMKCYYIENEGFNLRLNFKNPYESSVYSLNIKFGSLNYVAKYRVMILYRSKWMDEIKIISKYERACNFGEMIHCAFNPLSLSKRCWFHSAYLSNKLDRKYLETIQNKYSYYLHGTVSTDKKEEDVLNTLNQVGFHPISPYHLIFAMYDSFTISSLQYLLQNNNLEQTIEKINRAKPLNDLAKTIFANLLCKIEYTSSLYGTWEMATYLTKFKLSRFIETFNCHVRHSDPINIKNIILHSWNYPSNCNFKIMNEIFNFIKLQILPNKVFYEKPLGLMDEKSILCFNIENYSQFIIDEWYKLCNKDDTPKLQALFDQLPFLERNNNVKFFRLDDKFIERWRYSVNLQRSKLESLISTNRIEKCIELERIIKHISTWTISLEFLLLSIISIYNNYASSNSLNMDANDSINLNMVIKFMFWMNEIYNALTHIFSIFNDIDNFKHNLGHPVKNELSADNSNAMFQEVVMDTLFEKKISKEEIHLLIEEMCFLTSRTRNGMLINVVNKLYLELCHYISN